MLARVTVTDAIIPVAGLGTRLLPATRSQPKEMLPVLDKPVVQYVVEELVQSGISRVLFVTGRRKRAIEDHFDADPELGSTPLIHPRTGLQILYTRQATPAGLGDAIRYGAGLGASGGVVVALGDAIIESPRAPGITRRLIEAFEAELPCAAVAVEEVAGEALSRYGVIDGRRRGDGLLDVRRVVEKPDPRSAPSRWAVAARYVLAPNVIAELRCTAPDDSGEVQVADALNALLARGEPVLAVPLDAGELRHDIGTIDAYVTTFVRYALRDPRLAPQVRALLADA
jgi:UTP--glucose-1-phosphate uridylyltransferase